MFETTSRERSAHDAGQIVRHREERDDQLGRVAEARIQEAADAGPRVLGRMLGRFADHPGEWDQGSAGDDEERRLVEVEDEPAEDRDGRSGQEVPTGSSSATQLA